MTNEVRTTDPDTGAQKGVKLERFDLVPTGPLTDLARHYGMGAHKYEDRNWELGYKWSNSYQAALRHLTQFWSGEDLDPDPFYDQFPAGVRPKHVTAAAWHCMALGQFMDQHREKDDRPKLYVPQPTGLGVLVHPSALSTTVSPTDVEYSR